MTSSSVDGHYHIDASFRCNNHCLFCLEGDHAGKALARTRHLFGRDFLDSRALAVVLRRFTDRDSPLIFAGGEPTLNPHLPELVASAVDAGFRRIGLQTNGRRLSYQGYLLQLVRAGIRRIGISLHGSRALVHDGQTRAPGSYGQTIKGLSNCLGLKSRVPGLEVSTHTTITRGNIGDMPDLLGFLLGEGGIDRIVVSPIIYEGEAAVNAGRLALSYSDMAERLRAGIDGLKRAGAAGLGRLVIVDLPRCVGRGLEPYLGPFDEVVLVAPGRGARRKASGLARMFAWRKRAECRRCERDGVCHGVHPRYVKRFGWDEFVPLGAR